MRITTSKDKLAYAIQRVEKAAGKNATMPILSCILIEATGSNLIVRATNLDLGIESTLMAKVESEGRVAVPAALLSSFISQIPKDVEISLHLKDKNLQIEAGKNKTVIKALEDEDFPTLPRITEGSTFTIPSESLVSGFRSVWYAAAPSSMKPELSSVYMYSKEGYVICAASDSFRLAEKKVRTEHVDISETILVPFRNVPDIVRVLEAIDGDVTVTSDRNQISFESRGVYIVSRLIDAVFPDYNQIIPKDVSTEVTMLKHDFVQSLKLATIFSDTFNQIHISINPAEDSCVVSSRSNDKGENQNAIPSTIEGESIEMNFNYRYLLDCISSIQSDSIVLKFATQHKPLVIKGISDPSFTYLVMPMNR